MKYNIMEKDASVTDAEKVIVVKASQRARYTFTWNNYPDDADDVLYKFYMNSCKRLGRGFEVAPSTGTKHIQGWMQLKKPLRITQFKYDLPLVHFEVMKKGIDLNIQYCSKEGNYMEFTRFMNIKTLVASQLYDWQKDIVAIIEKEPDDRTIHWYWENVGKTGKSTFCKYLVIKYDAFCVIGSSGDMKAGLASYYEIHNVLPKIILLDLPRGIISPDYTGMEQIKNGLFYSTKYKSNMIVGNSPHVIVFSNYEPDVNRMSVDRWRVNDLNVYNA